MWSKKEMLLFKKFTHRSHSLKITFESSKKVTTSHLNICRRKCRNNISIVKTKKNQQIFSKISDRNATCTKTFFLTQNRYSLKLRGRKVCVFVNTSRDKG